MNSYYRNKSEPAAWHGGVWYASEDTPLVNNLDAPAEFFQQIKSGTRLFFSQVHYLTFPDKYHEIAWAGIVVSNWIFIHLAPLFFLLWIDCQLFNYSYLIVFDYDNAPKKKEVDVHRAFGGSQGEIRHAR